VNDRLQPLYEILRMNSRLFLNCLDGMDEDQARWRPTERTNSAAFLALHLVDSRHYMAKLVGAETRNPFAPLLEGAMSIDDIREYPSLDAIRDAWKAVTGNLRVRFKSLEADDLARPAPNRFPASEDPSLLGALTFLLQHDSYHIGQLALLRKQAGLEAMSYR
jgi:uncharacterized damage-inducible protein DinB